MELRLRRNARAIPVSWMALIPVPAVALATVVLSTACNDGSPESDKTPDGSVPVSSGTTVASLAGELFQGDKALAVGDVVAEGVPLELRRGRAVLSVPGVGEVQLSHGARLEVHGFERLRLLLGRIWLKVAPRQGHYEVETDNAIAGIRGTRFRVEVERAPDGTPTTHVGVAEGKVAVQRRTAAAATPEAPAEVLVPAGSQTSVAGETAPSPPSAFVAAAQEQSDAGEDEASEAPAPGGPAPMAPPKPKVEVDRKAFEELERQGKEKKQALERESDAQRRELQREEEEQRRRNNDKDAQQRDLEDMGPGKSKGPDQGSPKPKKNDDEMKDFLK